MLLEFLNFWRGGIWIRTWVSEDCPLCPALTWPLGSVGIIEVPVSTTVHVWNALHQDHPCSRDLFLEVLTEELDIRCASNFKYTLREKSTLKLLACFPFSLVWYQAEPKNTSCPSSKHQDRGWWVPACPHHQHCHRHNLPQRNLAVKNAHVLLREGKKKGRKQVKLAFGEKFLWKKAICFPRAKWKKKKIPTLKPKLAESAVIYDLPYESNYRTSFKNFIKIVNLQWNVLGTICWQKPTLQADLWENKLVKGLIQSPLKTMEMISLTSVAFRSKSPQSSAWKNESWGEANCSNQ